MNNPPEDTFRQIEIEGDFFQIFERNDPLVIFDVGACEGLDSIVHSRCLTTRRFTPLSQGDNTNNGEPCFIQLSKHPCSSEALSNRIGTATFYLSGPTSTYTDLETWDYGNKSVRFLRQPQSYR
jgi:hypothetical protein